MTMEKASGGSGHVPVGGEGRLSGSRASMSAFRQRIPIGDWPFRAQSRRWPNPEAAARWEPSKVKSCHSLCDCNIVGSTAPMLGQQPRPIVAEELGQLFQPKLLPRLRETLRLRRYSLKTEKAHVQRVRRYIHFHGKQHPQQMGAIARERPLWRTDANGRNVVEADLEIAFPWHRQWRFQLHRSR